MINYSFIIPHKNSLRLLERCIASIPARDDEEIIVVDDDSDSKQVDWATFKYKNRPNLSVVINKDHKGAGHARNVGLEHAKGKWILFADADDYYNTAELEKILDKYVDSTEDVVYWCFTKVDESGAYLNDKLYGYMDDYLSGKKSIDYLRYKINMPWNKMVSHDLIAQNKIQFEEVLIGNDIFYSYQVGYYSKKFAVEPGKVYYYVRYAKSQTGKIAINDQKLFDSLVSIVKRSRFHKAVGHKEWSHGIVYQLYCIFRTKDPRIIYHGLKVLIMDRKKMNEVGNLYVDTVMGNKTKNSDE